MRDAFGVERTDISKGLPSVLNKPFVAGRKAARTPGGKPDEAFQAALPKGVRSQWNAASRKAARSKKGRVGDKWLRKNPQLDYVANRMGRHASGTFGTTNQKFGREHKADELRALKRLTPDPSKRVLP